MAKSKTKDTAPNVRCIDCYFCPGVVVNHLVDCDNSQANPGGYKKGCWEHPCRHFKAKK